MTIKQKAVAKKILENPSLPVGRAMLEVGYSENSATAPSKNLLESKGWKELMEKYLPDDKLLKAHEEALNAIKIVTSPTEEDSVLPDHQIRLKAVELGYKLKGKTAENQSNVQVNVGEGANKNEIVFINFKNDTES